MKRSLPSLIAGAVLVIVLGAYMITYQVRFYELGVVRTFGKISPPEASGGPSPDVKTEPGWYLRWPWPIQKVDVYDRRIQVTRTVGEEMGTQDAKNVIVTTAIGWRIRDAYVFARTCRSITEAAENLKTMVRDQQKLVIGKYEFAHLVSIDRDQLRHDKIQREILAQVRALSDELYGIEVESLGLETLTLPQKISATVFKAMKEERGAQAVRYTSEGKSTATNIKDRADKIANTILSFADRKAAEIVAEGRARAADYNKEFAQDQELAIFLLEIENLVKMLAKRTTVILSAQERPLYLLEGTEPPTSTGQAPSPGGGASLDLSTLSPPPDMVKPK